MAFRQIANFSRPIVHLSVDVDVVVAVPRRIHVFAPQALQVCWQAAFTRRCDQQIATVLKVECFKVRVDYCGRLFFVTLQALERVFSRSRS